MLKMNKPGLLILTLPVVLTLYSNMSQTLFAQVYPAAEQSYEDSEAFFPKKRSLNSAIEKSREDQKKLQENAYPTA